MVGKDVLFAVSYADISRSLNGELAGSEGPTVGGVNRSCAHGRKDAQKNRGFPARAGIDQQIARWAGNKINTGDAQQIMMGLAMALPFVLYFYSKAQSK